MPTRSHGSAHVQSRFLRTFLVVARTRSVTRAAEALHLAQSSVSDQIQALETEWGATLFNRTRQGFDLTPAGRALKPYAEKILAFADDAQAAVDAASGHDRALVIGALETLAASRLPRWLDDLRGRHAGITVNVTVAGSGALLQGVKDGSLDAALCFDRSQRDQQLVTRVLGTEELVHIGPPGSRGLAAPSPDQRQATDHFITTPQGCIYRHLFDRALAEVAPWTPASVSEVGSIAAIGQLVAAGMGSALVPRLAAQDLLDRGAVIELPWHAPLPPASLVLAWRRRPIQPPALKRFLEAASAGEVTPADGRPRRAARSRS